MEKKNTVLLTVIAVATLLVAVVGATFAYFTATAEDTGAGSGAANIDTVQVADAVALNTTASKSENAYYPGTINYAAATVSANKTTATSGNTLNVSYGITGSVTIDSKLGSNVSWKLYKTTSPVDPVITADSCGSVAHEDGTGTKYYQTCTANTAFDSAKVVDSGTGSKASISDTGTLTTGTGTTGGQSVYYYLVVSYANVSDNQNNEQGANISFQLNAATATATVVTPAP